MSFSGLVLRVLGPALIGVLFISGYQSSQHAQEPAPDRQALVRRLIEAKPESRNDILSGQASLYSLELIESLSGVAHDFVYQKKYDEGESFYQLAARVAQAIGNQSARAYTLLDLANLDLLRSRPEGAVQRSEETLSYFDSAHDQGGAANAVEIEARAYQSEKKYAQALIYYGKALKLYESARDGSNIAVVLEYMANTSYEKADYDAALEFYKRSIATRAEAGQEDDSGPALANMASIYSLRKDYDRALETYQRALRIQEWSPDNDTLPAIYSGAARVEYAKHNYDDALRYYEHALAIYESTGDKDLAATTLEDIGNLYSDRGNYTSAIEYLRQSLELRTAMNSKARVAALLSAIGGVYYRAENYDKALEQYQTGLKEFQALGDKQGAQGILQSLGAVYYRREEFQPALTYYNKALDLARESSDRQGISSALVGIGLVRAAERDLDAALKAFDAALKLESAPGDARNIADITQDTGMVYSYQGTYGLALRCYFSALKLYDDSGDARAALGVYDSVADIYVRTGNYAAALQFNQLALTAASKLADKPATAREFARLARNHQLQGESTKAQKEFQKSLDLAQQAGDKPGIADAFSGLGDLFLGKGESKSALDYYNKALSVEQAAGNKEPAAYLLCGISGVQATMGDDAGSLDSAGQAVEIARRIGNDQLLWRALSLTGSAQLALGKTTEAQQAYMESIRVLRANRDSRIVPAGQRLSLTGAAAPYLGMVELSSRLHKPAEAFMYAEQAKAERMLGVIQDGGVQVEKGLSPQEIDKERNVVSTLLSVRTRIYKENLRSVPDTAKLAALAVSLKQAQSDYDAFEVTLYSLHPELAGDRGLAEPGAPQAALEDVGAALSARNDTAIAEYALTASHAYLFVLTGKSGSRGQGDGSRPGTGLEISQYTINESPQDLIKRALQFRRMVIDSDPGLEKAGRDLFDLLIAPAKDLLSGKTRLVVIPDSGLWGLPFQALQPAPGRFLIEDASVCYTPSLEMLDRLAKNRANPVSSSRPPGDVLVVKDPVVSKDTLDLVKLSYPGYTPDAPSSPENGSRTEAHESPSFIKTLSGAEATKVQVKAAARDFKVIDFAASAVLDDRNPMHSAVLLARVPDSQPGEDGLLETGEIAAMNLRADVVLLSTADLAEDRLKGGESLIGTEWSLSLAGCPVTIMSQWRSSRRTEMTAGLYQRLMSKTKDARGALAEMVRENAVEMIRDKTYGLPCYWAGFFVLGPAF
ncbi:MAG TPA: tetratricopeptide repeat protein [Blastocatellia bacterium]|nr:tetratricopeptide repeat protein [Blastocatellia bacterium]